MFQFLRAKFILAPLGMPQWVWPSMNWYKMFYHQTSTLPPSMHHKLTKYGRSCVQSNQLPTKSHAELEDNTIMLIYLEIDITKFCYDNIYKYKWYECKLLTLLVSVNSLNRAILVAHASSCSYPKPVTRSDLSICSESTNQISKLNSELVAQWTCILIKIKPYHFTCVQYCRLET